MLLVFLAVVVGVSALGGRLVAAVAAVAVVAARELVPRPAVPHVHDRRAGEHRRPRRVRRRRRHGRLARRHRSPARRPGASTARAEAEALARAAADLVGRTRPAARAGRPLRTTFALDGVRLRDLGRADTPIVAETGVLDGEPTVLVPVAGRRLGDGRATSSSCSGGRSSPDDQRVLRVLADQLTVAIDNQRLARDAADAALLANVDAVRTALLRAVSHDLRTPLAVDQGDGLGASRSRRRWTPEQLAEGLATIDSETDRLNRLVVNLLDASRLQTGAVGRRTFVRPTSPRPCVARSTASARRRRASCSTLADDLPLVAADPALLERAIANLLSNAIALQPGAGIGAGHRRAFGDTCSSASIDRGPGIPQDQHAKVLAPFQRLGDRRHPTASGSACRSRRASSTRWVARWRSMTRRAAGSP